MVFGAALLTVLKFQFAVTIIILCRNEISHSFTVNAKLLRNVEIKTHLGIKKIHTTYNTMWGVGISRKYKRTR